MQEIGAFEAKNRLGTLLDRAERGEEITITRRGRAVARLVPAQSGTERGKARAAAARILARGEGVTLGGLSLKELVAEGRP
jgi:prevent-host-death family protein